MRFVTAEAHVASSSGDAAQSAAGRQLPEAPVWALADAAGGRARATRAASRAIEAFTQSLARSGGGSSARPQERLRAAVDDANQIVHEEDWVMPASLELATSFVAALVHDDRLLVAHAGSARCYRFRAGHRVLLTRPHTAAEALELDEGSLFATHHRHIVTRALGIAARAQPELSEHVLRPGDLFILVNDGLARIVEDRQVADVFVHKATAAAVAATISRLASDHRAEGVVIAIDVAEEADGHSNS